MGSEGSRIVTQCLDQLNSLRVFYFTNVGACELAVDILEKLMADILEKLMAADSKRSDYVQPDRERSRGIGFVTTSQLSLSLVLSQLLQRIDPVRVLRV